MFGDTWFKLIYSDDTKNIHFINDDGPVLRRTYGRVKRKLKIPTASQIQGQMQRVVPAVEEPPTKQNDLNAPRENQ